MTHFGLAFEQVTAHGRMLCRVFFFAKSSYAPADMQDGETSIQFIRCSDSCPHDDCPIKKWTMVSDPMVERTIIGSALYQLGVGTLAGSPITEDDKTWVLGLVAGDFTHQKWMQLSDLLDQAITEAMMERLK